MASLPAIKLSVPEVLASVKSLYADDLKPFGRVLLKRLRERAAAAAASSRGLPAEAVDPESMPKIDPKRLRNICQRCPQLCVDSEEGREFSVTLQGRHCSFLDACNPHDPYPQTLWDAATAYFQSLSCEEMYLPGGRYASARALLKRRLPFLTGCSLGQVCHIVQLAISQKRLLGFLEGHLVPRPYSEEWVKEQCAFHQLPAGDGVSSLPVASWGQARQRLRELLDSDPHDSVSNLTLSNVKRLFRDRFQLELSETALGHSRMFDLLHDVRFRDVCSVQAHRNGQLLVKRVDGPYQVPCHLLSLQQPEVPQPQKSGCLLAATAESAAPEVWDAVCLGSVTYPISCMLPSLATLRNVQVDLGMDTCWQPLPTGISPQDFRLCADSKGCDEDSDQSTDFPYPQDLAGCSSDDGERQSRSSLLAAQAEAIRAEEESAAVCLPLCSDISLQECDHFIKNTFIDIPSPASIGSKRRLRSVPKDMGTQSTTALALGLV